MGKILAAFMGFYFAFAIVHGSETVKGAKADMQKFKTEMSAKLDQIEKELVVLKDKAKQKGSQVKEETVKDLETARDKAKADLANVKEDTKSGWEKFKHDLSSAIDNLNTKVQKALKE